MRWLVSIALLVAMNCSAKADEVCTPPPLQSFQVKVDRFGRLSLPLTVDGKTTDAMICTSCQWSSLSEKFLKENGLDIRNGDVRFGNWDGSRNYEKSVIHEVKFGNINVTGYSEFLISRGEDAMSSIGMNLLSLFDFEIDNANNSVTFYRHQRCGRPNATWAQNAVELKFNMREEYPQAVVELNGKNLEVAIESASPFTLMGAREAKVHLGILPSTPGVRPSTPIYFEGSEKPFNTYEYTLPSLVISGIAFQNVPVRIVEIDDYGISLGQHELRQLHLFFTFESKKIFAAPIEITHQ